MNDFTKRSNLKNILPIIKKVLPMITIQLSNEHT